MEAVTSHDPKINLQLNDKRLLELKGGFVGRMCTALDDVFQLLKPKKEIKCWFSYMVTVIESQKS